MDTATHDRLLIVDFGSQVTQLIARRLRELHVYCENPPVPGRRRPAFLDAFAPKAIILSGGPCSVLDDGSPRAPDSVFARGVPVLGICYGQQVMMTQLGGQVSSGHGTAEFGRAFVTPADDRLDLLEGWFDTGREQVWMSHGDNVSRLAPGFLVYGTSPNAPYAITADPSRHFYAVQFHPESPPHPERRTALRELRPAGGLHRRLDHGRLSRTGHRSDPRAGRATRKSICGLSGGVDSSVAAVLIHEAIGDQLTCVFVDHGLLRKNEAQEVVTMFRDHYNIPLIHADETELFLGALEGQSDPETKRKTIGKLFIDVFQKTRGGGRRRRISRPGHPLPRRDRKRQLLGRPPRSPHQVAPQRGRPAGKDGPQARRTPSGTLQGRGPRAWPRTRPAAVVHRPPPLPPAPASPSAARARSRARNSPSCARPTRSISTRSASTASMTTSGRPSSPSSPSAPSA